MDLQQFIKTLRVRWKFIVVTLLLGTMLSAGFAMSKSPTYESTGRIFIVVPNDIAGNGFSTLLVTQRASSYADLAKDPTLLQKVLARSGLNISLTELSSRIRASVVVDTQIVRITATGESPEEAKSLADVEVQQLLALVKDLERPADEDAAPAVVARAAGEPSLNLTTTGPPLWLSIFLGFVLSGLIGVMGAVLRDRLDLTVKTRRDVEDEAGAPVVSALPLDSAVAKDRRSTVQPDSSLAEGFRVLRANLRFADLDASRQMILVTSALANEGKTLTAVNLAQSLAATGQSVLLIDCDLRSPSVAADLGLENAVGMLSVLLGHVTLTGAIQAHSSGLDVLPTGPRPPNPSEVLATDAVANLLNEAREAYDVIVIDAPPILPVADTSPLISHVDGVLLLARFGRTKKDVLRLAADRIEGLGGRLYGVVLNGIPRRGGDEYGYGYGYGYGGRFDRPETPTQRSGGGRRRVDEDPQTTHEAFR
jgi:receptor protein-tyrosine kinase